MIEQVECIGPPAGALASENDVCSVLLVSDRECHRSGLRGIIGRTRWRLHHATSCDEASVMMRELSLGVIISDTDIAPAGWRGLLDETRDLAPPPNVIVASNLADDRLWGEVLNLGGYDVLPTPFDADEVTRVVSLAWMHWKRQATPQLGRLAEALLDAAHA